MFTQRKHFPGFTLIELVVVIALIAILAGLVLPKLDGLQGNANHAISAASADDTGRYIQVYRTTKQRLPDGWDSLMDGSDLWAPANPATTPPTQGLHSELAGPTPKLAKHALVAGEVAALNSAGIYTIYNHSTGSTLRPGDQFNDQATIAVGAFVAQVIPGSTSPAAKIIDHIYRDNQKTGGPTGTGVSGTIPTGKSLIAFGFGPHNALIGHTMLEVPAYENVDPTLIYNRNLVIFEVGTTGKAVFKCVTGADGDLIDDMATSLSKDIN